MTLNEPLLFEPSPHLLAHGLPNASSPCFTRERREVLVNPLQTVKALILIEGFGGRPLDRFQSVFFAVTINRKG